MNRRGQKRARCTDLVVTYAGSSFNEFVALIYMTGAWLTEEMLAEEWKKVGSPKNWRAIIVVGRGRVASPASSNKVKTAPVKKAGPVPKSIHHSA